jgi:hypothetical protein
VRSILMGKRFTLLSLSVVLSFFRSGAIREIRRIAPDAEISVSMCVP